MIVQFRVPVDVEAKTFSTAASILYGETPSSCLEIKAANARHETLRLILTVSRKETIVSICDATGSKASITLVGGEPTCVKGEKCEVNPTVTQVWWECHSICLRDKKVEVSLYDTDYECMLFATFKA